MFKPINDLIEVHEITDIPMGEQFIAVWIYDEKLWCDTVRLNYDHKIEYHDQVHDRWDSLVLQTRDWLSVRYFIQGK